MSMTPFPPPRPRRWIPVVAAVLGVLVVAGAGFGTYYLVAMHRPAPVAATGPAAAPSSSASPSPAPAPAPTPAPKTVVVPAPHTVTAPAPAPTFTAPVTTDDATPISCESDGTTLSAQVGILNPTSETHDFIGTLSFTSVDGNALGQGGFSIVDLGPGSTGYATVDTSDPNDPRAQTYDLSGTEGPVNCAVTDLHTK